MTTALRRLFLPRRSQLSPAYTAVQCRYPPCGHRGARLSLAEKREWQEERERGGEGEEAEEKNKGAAQPCVTNNRRSAAAALSTPTPAVVAWLLPLKWEAFERHQNFVLLVPWSTDGIEPGGSVLVYPDSCSKAGCHNRVPSCSDLCRCWVTELHGSARAQLRTTARMILIVCSRKVEISASQDIILTHAGTLTHT